jgi:hypothetical protein
MILLYYTMHYDQPYSQQLAILLFLLLGKKTRLIVSFNAVIVKRSRSPQVPFSHRVLNQLTPHAWSMQPRTEVDKLVGGKGKVESEFRRTAQEVWLIETVIGDKSSKDRFLSKLTTYHVIRYGGSINFDFEPGWIERCSAYLVSPLVVQWCPQIWHMRNLSRTAIE